ncbi:MAG: 2-oxo acid dehydrogenase subunit E2 [Calditrichaceae bacterium]|nr:2-oxo acid dehydrogenase subunit E2 [Calditrichaceae bacterium]MBN2707758.1 2-oxo acid dehydrogenase subunit E2 [Calditrichaceae bacterium]RQV96392.1 MAG: biotin/lipoyl-binding protein [Calditrichota bacterium]
MSVEIKLPELGENIESGRVVSILVKEGDTVTSDQSVLELETDKAVIEVPASSEGKIAKLHVKEGDEIKVGQVIMSVDSAEGEATKTVSEEKSEAETEIIEEIPAEEAKEEKKEISEPVQEKKTDQISASVSAASLPEKDYIAPAAPSVRRFAREIGIDINSVKGTGPAGRISIDDVKAYSKQMNEGKKSSTALLKGVGDEPLPDFSKWGPVDHQPMNKVRETTARHLSYAWATIPHVTQFDKTDITELEQLRKKYSPQVEKNGGKLTVTAILVKIITGALKQFPQFNASIDMLNKEIIYKKYYNIGIAVDTERGLLVPVIKNVDQKSITEISVELSLVSEKARDRKLSLEEMQGGNFSISNLGGIGGTGFTPIVNSPEVAILGVSRSQTEPVFKDGGFTPRLMLPLALSYDHRLIDGADAARFLRWICQALEEPFLLAL